MCATATSTLLSASLQAVFLGQAKDGKKVSVRKKMDNDKQYRKKMKLYNTNSHAHASPEKYQWLIHTINGSVRYDSGSV